MLHAMRSICVFCGSSAVVDPRFLTLAYDVGALLAKRGVRMVYGGASVGMMGTAADAAMSNAGRVLGVIPAALDEREIAHRGVTELRVVDTMHTRKKVMADESDGFVALPGGFGTLDELFEITTWRQIGLHSKPIALFDLEGYYRPLIAWIERASAEKFVPESVQHAIEVVTGIDAFDTWLGRVPERTEDVR
jgi:uncharacterized protein (TIGR00730 family)